MNVNYDGITSGRVCACTPQGTALELRCVACRAKGRPHPPAWVEELFPAPPPANEAVNRPSHYDLGVGQGLQVMDLVEAQAAGLSGFDGFLLGNVLKYVLRFQRKGQPLQDLKKARHYLDLLISKTESASEPPGET